MMRSSLRNPALALLLAAATTAGAPPTEPNVRPDRSPTGVHLAAEPSEGARAGLARQADAAARAARDGARREALTAAADRAAENAADQAARAAAEAAYPDNLDGWIREALAVMRQHGIPGTYDGIHRNILRESSGDPDAVNNWDINAQNGTPSKGLLQVIRPTFDAYHVPGTAWDLTDPIANITAACNYAADQYGSIDNVHGPY